MKHIIVRYAEIALKGRNRSVFEKRLVDNIKLVLGIYASQVRRETGQIIVEISLKKIELVLQKLGRVFGIAWYAEARRCESDKKEIVDKAFDFAKKNLNRVDGFAVRASRSEKSLSFTSKDIENWVGDAVRKGLGLKVDLSDPDKTIYISVGKNSTYIFGEKLQGAGGLPIGTSGKVLSLLSGGFDSIASSYLLAKRGAEVDFLHYHVFPDEKGVLDSKMPKIWDKLSEFTLSKRVFLASYIPFQMRVIDLKRKDERLELVVFRRLMVRVGEEIAKKYRYQALVLGDSLGQVASQTMENIVVIDDAVSIPIFRPLIGFDKVQIIDLVKRIGLEGVASDSYKDCCSLVSTHPSTKADLVKVERLEKLLRVEEIVGEVVDSVEQEMV